MDDAHDRILRVDGLDNMSRMAKNPFQSNLDRSIDADEG